jgi:circadian clock protein KaiC
VVLDTIEVLFSALTNQVILRAELHRLFRWLKEKGVTAVITAERGNGTMTRFGLEEYVADCVILLDHRLNDQVSTRRLRIVKYRGTLHGTNEYPFLIGGQGILVLPITSLKLEHQVSTERISTGVQELDEMLGSKGFYRGTSVLVSGTAGTGKTTLASTFVDATCKRGERCLYFAFEESTGQILRNMRSVGLELAPHLKKGLLQIRVARPSQYGLELHLVTMYDMIQSFKPSVVILDPITDFATVGSAAEVKAAVTRIIDFLKSSQITGMFIAVTSGRDQADQSVVGVSSLIDAWISLRNLEHNGERRRGLFVLKSRGMAHSNQIRSFELTSNGIRIGSMDLAEHRAQISSS